MNKKYGRNDRLVATATDFNGIYKLNVKSMKSFTAIKRTTQELWHKRLGHLNDRSMALLRNGMAHGVQYLNSERKPCIACIQGKQSRSPFKKSGSQRGTTFLKLVHADLCGPMSEPSWSGARYLFSLIDDFSAMTFGYFLKTKDQVLEVFKEFKTLVENQTGHTIKIFRTDNGGEFVNQEMNEYLKNNGIRHQTSIPYNPEQNGVAERANRTIMEKSRCMLHNAKLNKKYWAEAVSTAIYLKNRSPTKAVKGKTPIEVWTGRKPNLQHLRIFGCKAYAHLPKHERKKLDAKSKECIFVGYCSESKGYRLVDRDNPKKIIKSRDSTFLENEYQNQCTSKIDPNTTRNEFRTLPLIETSSNEEVSIEDQSFESEGERDTSNSMGNETLSNELDETIIQTSDSTITPIDSEGNSEED